MTPTQPPSFVKAVVAGVVRHALTGAAGAMVAAGMIQTKQQAEVIDIGLAVALWGFGVWWSAIQKKNTPPQSAPAEDPPY